MSYVIFLKSNYVNKIDFIIMKKIQSPGQYRCQTLIVSLKSFLYSLHDKKKKNGTRK